MLGASLASQPYFSSCACAGERGRACARGKIRLACEIETSWVPGSDSVAATPPGKIALLTLSLRRPLIEGNSRHGTPTKDACYAKAVKGVTPAVVS